MQKQPPIRALSFMQFSLPVDFPLWVDLKADYPYIGSNLREPHVHECLEVGYCHRGKGYFEIGAKRLFFKTGDISVINQTEPHIAHFSVPSSWTWIYIDPVRLLTGVPVDSNVLQTDRLSGPHFMNILHGSDHPGLSGLVRNIIEELETRRKGYRDVIRGLVLSMVSLLHRLENDDKSRSPSKHPAASSLLAIRKIGPALDYMNFHYSEDIPIKTLTDLVAMSATSFRRVFKQLLGVSPHRYLNNYRLKVACGMLRNTDKGIETICYECGYDEPSVFRKQFKQELGCSPGAWRKKNRT